MEKDQERSLRRGLMLGFMFGGLWGLWKAPRPGVETRSAMWQRIAKPLRKIQGEPIEEAIEQGKAIAHRKRAEHAIEVKSNQIAAKSER